MKRLWRGIQRHPGNPWFLILPVIAVLAGRSTHQELEALLFLYAFFAGPYLHSAWHHGGERDVP